MGKVKQYYYDQECKDIYQAIQNIDFGDQDFQPTMAEMVNQVMDKQKKKPDNQQFIIRDFLIINFIK